MSVNQNLFFGKIIIPSSQVFLLRKNVYGLVNLKPIVDGHVLVATRKRVARLHELTEIETLDFWSTVQEVSKVIGNIYKQDVDIVVQDGSAAGQSVGTVHCHILPKNGLQKIDDEERQPRQEQEMTEEASKLRPYFEQQNII